MKKPPPDLGASMRLGLDFLAKAAQATENAVDLIGDAYALADRQDTVKLFGLMFDLADDLSRLQLITGKIALRQIERPAPPPVPPKKPVIVTARAPRRTVRSVVVPTSVITRARRPS